MISFDNTTADGLLKVEPMTVLNLAQKRLRAFRPTPVAVVLFVIATIRMTMSGSGVDLVGICAGIVPYICVCNRWELRTEVESAGMLADWLCGLAFAAIYLAWMVLVTLTAYLLNPAYVVEPSLLSKLVLAVAGDLVFVSVAYPLCTLLPKGVRLLPGIVLVNAQIALMLLCNAMEVASQPWAVTAGVGFSVLLSAVALGLIVASSRMDARLR